MGTPGRKRSSCPPQCLSCNFFSTGDTPGASRGFTSDEVGVPSPKPDLGFLTAKFQEVGSCNVDCVLDKSTVGKTTQTGGLTTCEITTLAPGNVAAQGLSRFARKPRPPPNLVHRFLFPSPLSLCVTF